MLDFNLLPIHSRFPLGKLVLTATVLQRLPSQDIADALVRHAKGDWGDACPEDCDVNESALRMGLRLLSVYHDRFGVKFWIITEADRSATTVLLPEDY